MLDNKSVRLILASTSPRRRQLLGLSGWVFDIIPAEVDETPLLGESAQDYVLRLAEAKARAVAQQAQTGDLIIAADTTVADGEKILGKPIDGQDAFNMLQSLRGRVHQVHTAIAVFDPKNNRMLTDLASTDVPMRDYSDAEINEYIATGDPFDKAGSYAIQHPGFKPVSHLSGCYANVVGLPLCHLERILKQFEAIPVHDLPQACQLTLQYTCTEYTNIQNSPPRAFRAFRIDAHSGAEGEL
jgi:septum formation protein